MSFGFSVGDFIAVTQLIADVIKSLRETGGAKSEYRELLRELDGLQCALSHLKSLSSRNPGQTLESIKYAALSCRKAIEDFLGKISKYDGSLAEQNTSGPIKRTAHKLRWTFGRKNEIQRLQSYLNIHIGTINMLLAEHSLERMSLAADKVDTNHVCIKERLEETRGIVQCMKNNMSAQTEAIRNTHSVLVRLFNVMSGELKTFWNSLSEMVAKPW